MKSTKLLIIISELWNEKQLAAVRNSLLRGVEELNNKCALNETIEELGSRDFRADIELETCSVQILINADKKSLLHSWRECSPVETLLVVYVGPITAPGGQWLLRDSALSPADFIQNLDDVGGRAVVATLAPCEEWLAAEKRHQAVLTVCGYDLVQCGNPIVLGLSDFVDNLYCHLTVAPCDIPPSVSTSFLKSSGASMCLFFDPSSSLVPCLFLVDGFSLLLNVGYGCNSALRHLHHLDAALLTHLSHANLLPLTAETDSHHIGHLFLPCRASLDERSYAQPESPYSVELGNELAKLVRASRERGTGLSVLCARASTATSTGTTSLKPVPLFHKIGYGCLEMVAVEVGAGSAAVLLLWRPHAARERRLLYMGAQARPGLLARALPSAVDLLRQAAPPPPPPVSKKPATLANGAPKRPPVAVGVQTAKKAPVATRPSTAKVAESKKSPRPTTTARKKPETLLGKAVVVTTTVTVAADAVANVDSIQKIPMEANLPAASINQSTSECSGGSGGGRAPVAVGTVECAITEHGEADFCDDTPEEYSAAQMKEMGLYDDDDEEGGDRSSAHVSDNPDIGPSSWRLPLSMPLPARDIAGPKKPPSRPGVPLQVDCLVVPAGLDRDDLRTLQAVVRATTVCVQSRTAVEALLEAGMGATEVVVAGCDWLTEADRGRMRTAGLTVTEGTPLALFEGCFGCRRDL